MECNAIAAITAKVMFVEEPKWTTVMTKNVWQVVNQVVETLADVPKKEERKLNLRLTDFKTKEGKTEKELVQQLNIELLQGQIKLCAKVVVTT